MTILSLISIISAKVTKFILTKIFKRGSSLPGVIALKIDKNILKEVAKGYKIILITGTNGKTTTTALMAHILKDHKREVVTNSTGANMISGITNTFIDKYRFLNTKSEKLAVIEVDEAYLAKITSILDANIIAVTNIFRDQLDRYGEIDITFNKIYNGIKNNSNAKIILNGDCSVLANMDIPNIVIYYGFKASFGSSVGSNNIDMKFCKYCNHPYYYNFVIYSNLGDYYCKNCGFSRPNLNYYCDGIIGINMHSSNIKLNGLECIFNNSGKYNIYNALTSFAISKELGLNDDYILNKIKTFVSAFGRQEIVEIDSKKINIILVKNPAGYNQVIDTLSINTNEYDCCFLLNDNYADGRDVSWIWDVEFERLANSNLRDVYIGGIRCYDMAIRLKNSSLTSEKFIIEQDYSKLTQKLKSSSTSDIYVLTTYTAMLDYRKYLYSSGYIKKIW